MPDPKSPEDGFDEAFARPFDFSRSIPNPYANSWRSFARDLSPEEREAALARAREVLDRIGDRSDLSEEDALASAAEALAEVRAAR